MMNLLLIALTVVAVAHAEQTRDEPKSLHPVLLIPGTQASRLEAKLDKKEVPKPVCKKQADWFTIWFDKTLLQTDVVDCFMDNFVLDFDEASAKPVNRPGVQIRTPDFGGTSSVEKLSPIKGSIGYMNKLVQALVKKGYKRGASVRAAPYDFRLAPNDNPAYLSALKNLAEKMYADAGNKRVILLSHSTGSRNLLYFLQQQSAEWKAKHVERWISSAGSFGGDVATLATLSAGVEGLEKGLTGQSEHANAAGLSRKNTRKLFRSHSSTIFLAPDPLAFKEEPIFQLKDKNFTAAQMSDIFQKIGHQSGMKQLRRTGTLIKSMDAPGVKVSCFFGSKVPTIAKIVYKDDKSLLDGAELVQGDGDGNINRISSTICENWSKSEGFESKEFQKINHMNMIRDKSVVAAIIASVSKVNAQQ